MIKNRYAVNGGSEETMYLHLVYYSGDRSMMENVLKNESLAITADRTFFLDAVDNDGDALRFQHNNGSHFDMIFLHQENAQQVYGDILAGIRESRAMLEMDIRQKQIG